MVPVPQQSVPVVRSEKRQTSLSPPFRIKWQPVTGPIVQPGCGPVPLCSVNHSFNNTPLDTRNLLLRQSEGNKKSHTRL